MPAAWAEAARVAAEDDVRRRVPIPEVLEKTESVIEFEAVAMSNVSLPPLPETESAAINEEVATEIRSFPVPPTRVRASVSPALCVMEEFPLPPKTLTIPVEAA